MAHVIDSACVSADSVTSHAQEAAATSPAHILSAPSSDSHATHARGPRAEDEDGWTADLAAETAADVACHATLLLVDPDAADQVEEWLAEGVPLWREECSGFRCTFQSGKYVTKLSPSPLSPSSASSMIVSVIAGRAAAETARRHPPPAGLPTLTSCDMLTSSLAGCQDAAGCQEACGKREERTHV